MEGRATRVLVAVAIFLVVVADAPYLAIVFNQGAQPPESFTTPFVAVYLALMAALLAASLMNYDCVNGHLTYHSGSCTSGAIDENGNVTHPGC